MARPLNIAPTANIALAVLVVAYGDHRAVRFEPEGVGTTRRQEPGADVPSWLVLAFIAGASRVQ